MLRVARFLIVIGLGFILVACGSTDTSDPADISSSSETVAESNPTEAVSSDTPEARGAALFSRSYAEVGFACASCHYTSNARLIGPGMTDIASRLADYDIDESLEDYIRSSILNPQAFIPEEMPAYPENVMPQTYNDIFSEDELNDLIAYIISL